MNDNKDIAEDRYQVTTRQEVSEASCSLLAEAQRTIDILVYDYDDIFLPPAKITELVSQFFIRHRQNRFRYLCSESDLLRERGRSLIEIARKYSTYVKLRQLPDGLKPMKRQYLVVDTKASMMTREHTTYDYFIHTSDRVHARQLENHFEELWQRSDAVPGIHVTGLSG